MTKKINILFGHRLRDCSYNFISSSSVVARFGKYFVVGIQLCMAPTDTVVVQSIGLRPQSQCGLTTDTPLGDCVFS